MFYILISTITFLLIATYCVLKFIVFKNNEKFDIISNKILKIIAIVYASIMILTILLPDKFCLCLSQEELALSTRSLGYKLIRSLLLVNFVILPLSVFFKNRTIRNIAIYFCTTITIISVFYYPEFLIDFTSVQGKGLNSISIISQIYLYLQFLHFGITLTLQILIPVVLAIQEKHIFDFKNKKEYLYFFITLPLIIISTTPIYIPQHLFGYTNLILEPYSIAHIGWLLLIIIQIFVLYIIFKNKTIETKLLMLYVLSLSLLMQYLQMFSAISINFEKLPFQLCNMGHFFVWFYLLKRTKKTYNILLLEHDVNKKIFNFT